MNYLGNLAAFGCLLLATTPARPQATLIQDGKARAIIVAPAAVMDAKDHNPNALKGKGREAEVQRQRLRESVKDLALYLEKMSGAKVDIATKAETANQLLPILVGAHAVKAFGPPKKTAPFAQGFRVVISKNGVGLIGESELATSYAIYEVLHRLGCRWYMPSDLGEVIPKMATVTLPELDFSSAPGTIYRGLWYVDDAYRRRNRLGGLLLSAGHALEMYISAEERKKHPEWVGEVKGKPHPSRLKWSNAKLADTLADKILDMHAKDYQPSYSLSPDDGIDFDESKEDRAIDAGDFDTSAQMTAITDRLMVLCNRVADKVSKKHPDVLFGMLAYVHYTRPPVREKVHPNIVPQIAPITYSRAHPISDEGVPGNKELRAIIEGWGKKAKMTSLYFYGYFLAEPSAPYPNIAKWSHDVPFVLKNGCQFWQPETMPNFDTSLHALYMSCRLAWNPSEKPADIIDEINTKFYGAAAKEMAAYWSFIDGVWVNTPEYSGCGFGYLSRWAHQRMFHARSLMDAALVACKTRKELHRVRLADSSLELFELFMKLRRDLAEGRWARLADEGETWMKQVNYLAEKYKDQFTFSRPPWRETPFSSSYFDQFYHQTYKDASKLAKDFALVTDPIYQFRYHADPEKKGEKLGWAKADFNDGAWKTTDVTLETWSTLGYHDYFKSMWYRAETKVPPPPAGKKVFLWIGATDGSAKVFVNGQHVSHVDAKGKKAEAFDGYCQPFSLDITTALDKSGVNKIAILCTRTFFNELGTGGLIAPVIAYREK